MNDRYTCLDCGETFDEPGEIVERHGLESPPYEHILVCPYCLGSFVETVIT